MKPQYGRFTSEDVETLTEGASRLRLDPQPAGDPVRKDFAEWLHGLARKIQDQREWDEDNYYEAKNRD